MSDVRDNPFFSGRNEDGSISVVVIMRVTAQDEVALRANCLLDPTDGIPADLGIEAAVSRTVLSIIKGEATWTDAGLDRGLVNVLVGGRTSAG